MVLYPNKLPESERVCFGICNGAIPKLLSPEISMGGNFVYDINVSFQF